MLVTLGCSMVTRFLRCFAVVYGGLRVALVCLTYPFCGAPWSRAFLSASPLCMAACEYLLCLLLIPSGVLHCRALSPVRRCCLLWPASMSCVSYLFLLECTLVMRFVRCFAVVYSGCKCPTGDGYQSTTHGWKRVMATRVPHTDGTWDGWYAWWVAQIAHPHGYASGDLLKSGIRR